MRKGKNCFVLSGALNIILGIALISIVVMFFVFPDFVAGIGSSFAFELSLVIKDPVALIIYSLYGVIAVYGLIGILSLIFGIITIVKSKKETGSYYNKFGIHIYFLISEILCFAFFLASFIVVCVNNGFDIPLICISALSFMVLLFQFIGTIRFGIGKKQILKPSFEEKIVPELREYNDEGVDLITKIRRLNALRDSGEISEKQYLESKAKLLGE
ncbi:MAG: SHOCT domain-containing protein [Firmicutes bacterium]|nr:SHOCT domain-containing protein [Bacillota bacterium]MDY3659131.1 SHOCT domain-containing protein [Eubacteriales bacterium]